MAENYKSNPGTVYVGATRMAENTPRAELVFMFENFRFPARKISGAVSRCFVQNFFTASFLR